MRFWFTIQKLFLYNVSNGKRCFFFNLIWQCHLLPSKAYYRLETLHWDKNESNSLKNKVGDRYKRERKVKVLCKNTMCWNWIDYSLIHFWIYILWFWFPIQKLFNLQKVKGKNNYSFWRNMIWQCHLIPCKMYCRLTIVHREKNESNSLKNTAEDRYKRGSKVKVLWINTI